MAETDPSIPPAPEPSSNIDKGKQLAKKYWWVAAAVLPFGSVLIAAHLIKKWRKKK